MDINILYKDKDFLIINKPPGLVVHSDGRTNENSVADWILEEHPELKEVGEPWKKDNGQIIYRPGIVHRLDRETSGVLVIAKNQESFQYLKNLFQTHQVSKIYNAFVYGEMKQDEGVIDRPIARSKKDFRQWSASPRGQLGTRARSREAITNFRVLKRIGPGRDAGAAGASYLEVRPETGRTHQIRVHLKAINHPVVCDKLYAPKHSPVLGFERLALHASRIEFEDLTGKVIVAEAPFPVDFQKALDLMT